METNGPMDFTGLGLNDLLAGIGPSVPKKPVQPERIQSAAATTTAEPAVATKLDQLSVRYGDPELDRKLATSGALKTIIISGLPVGIRLSQGVDTKGFYFYFDDGSHEFKRYYYPKGLREIRVNSNFINVDTERKWLIEAFVARYNRKLGSFMSLNNTSHVGTMLSYFCTLSHMPESKMDFLLQILNKSVTESTDPYFRLYLFDVVMARVIKLLIVRKFKTRMVTIDQSETVAVVDSAIELLKTVKEDALQALADLNSSADPEQFMPLSGSSFNTNPKAFWGGAFYQAEKRRSILMRCMPSLATDTILDSISESEMLLTLKEGVEANDSRQVQETSDQMEFHIQKVIKPTETRAVNWDIFK